jgi:hypothetical protein
MSWAERSKGIQVGDRVAYSAAWLRLTGQFTGDAPFARGIVTRLIPLGQTTLAEIDWGNDELPAKVNVANLSRVTDKGIIEPG